MWRESWKMRGRILLLGRRVSPQLGRPSTMLTPQSYCGQTEDFCTSPDCQINYGPACDGNLQPAGEDTSDIARPKVGKVRYGGVGIYDCVNKGDIAVTFDDGPYEYTNDLLDKFAVSHVASPSPKNLANMNKEI
ncbi:hypothetical protein F4805DRAFT_161775 [Annulohypoxylon moriforme]|nr:hypothetical protein F4805DRAFT_161775 [Annulohypoxylon moriforme]